MCVVFIALTLEEKGRQGELNEKGYIFHVEVTLNYLKRAHRAHKGHSGHKNLPKCKIFHV